MVIFLKLLQLYEFTLLEIALLCWQVTERQPPPFPQDLTSSQDSITLKPERLVWTISLGLNLVLLSFSLSSVLFILYV